MHYVQKFKLEQAKQLDIKVLHFTHFKLVKSAESANVPISKAQSLMQLESSFFKNLFAFVEMQFWQMFPVVLQIKQSPLFGIFFLYFYFISFIFFCLNII